MEFLSCDEKTDYLYLKYSENGFSHTYDEQKIFIVSKKTENIHNNLFIRNVFIIKLRTATHPLVQMGSNLIECPGVGPPPKDTGTFPNNSETSYHYCHLFFWEATNQILDFVRDKGRVA